MRMPLSLRLNTQESRTKRESWEEEVGGGQHEIIYSNLGRINKYPKLRPME
jgi:hypothetical protein